MYPVSFVSVVLPFGIAAITATAGLLYCCAKRMRVVPKDPIEEKIRRIDELARIIFENPCWWQIEGPFRVNGSHSKIELSEAAIKQAARSDFPVVVSTLRTTNLFEVHEPTDVLKRMVRELIDSSNIQSEELESRAPFFAQLVRNIIEHKDDTQMTRRALGTVLLQSKDAQEQAMRAFLSKSTPGTQITPGTPKRLNQSSR